MVGQTLESHISTNDLDCWQDQDVVLGTSLLSDSYDDASSPDVVEGNMFHDIYSEDHHFQAISGKCEIWSIMTNHLIYPNPEIL